MRRQVLDVRLQAHVTALGGTKQRRGGQLQLIHLVGLTFQHNGQTLREAACARLALTRPLDVHRAVSAAGRLTLILWHVFRRGARIRRPAHRGRGVLGVERTLVVRASNAGSVDDHHVHGALFAHRHLLAVDHHAKAAAADADAATRCTATTSHLFVVVHKGLEQVAIYEGVALK